MTLKSMFFSMEFCCLVINCSFIFIVCWMATVSWTWLSKDSLQTQWSIGLWLVFTESDEYHIDVGAEIQALSSALPGVSSWKSHLPCWPPAFSVKCGNLASKEWSCIYNLRRNPLTACVT
jgi:hypothetical protein